LALDEAKEVCQNPPFSRSGEEELSMEINEGVALVTGGASGLGEATVRRLSAAGARLVVVDRNAERGRAVAESLEAEAAFVEADVTDPAAVRAAIEVGQSMGPLRVVVNCAGIGWVQRTVARDGSPHSLDAFAKVVQVNLMGTFNILSQAAAAMAAIEPSSTEERGVIINTASVAAYDGQVGQIAYAASKAGIVGLTLPAARDLAVVGVRVVTIAPGLFDTPLLATLPDKARSALEKNIPFPRRLGQVGEFAAMVASIVTNPYLNGETIRLDGSLRMAPK